MKNLCTFTIKSFIAQYVLCTYYTVFSQHKRKQKKKKHIQIQQNFIRKYFITNFLRKYLHNIIAQLGNQAMDIIGQNFFLNIVIMNNSYYISHF